MISLLGTKLGLLYPLALAGVPLVLGALIYAYLRRGRGDKMPVGSTLILRLIKSQSSSRKKFVPPIRFFFELLLLLLLLGAVGGFFVEDDAQRVALLIDNSLSMGAHEPGQSEELIEIARARAGDYLRQLPSSALVEVQVVCPDLNSRSQGFSSPAAALTLLDGVGAEYCADALNAAIKKLLSQSEYSKVVVLTDKSLPQDADPNLNAKLLVLTVSRLKSGSNLMLKGMEWSSSAPGNTREIAVSLASFAPKSAQVDLRLEGFTPLDQNAPLKLIAARRISLAAGAHETVKFKDDSDSYSAYRAVLEPLPGSSEFDQLQSDNQGYLSLQAVKRRAVIISDLDADDLGLDLISWMKFEHVRPEAYAPEVLGTGELLIFHRFVPAVLPEGNLLFVAPEKSSALFTVGGGLSNAEITSWDETSTILDYLNLTLLNLREAKTLNSSSAAALIKVGAGSVALAGRQGPVRFAVTGFELFPFEAKRSPTLSILTLNLLRWFLADSGVTHTIVPFQHFSLSAADQELRFVTDEGAPIPAVSADGASASVDRPGLLVNALAGTTAVRAVNFSDEFESDLRARGSINVLGEGVKAATRAERMQLASKLGLLVLVLLLADLLVSSYLARRQPA